MKFPILGSHIYNVARGVLLIEQVVKAQNMTANMTDLYLDNMSQFDDSGRISSREPIAWPMC